MTFSRLFTAVIALGMVCTSCGDDIVEIPVETPATYEFTRNGTTTVSYQGQLDRLSHLGTMKSLMSSANGGSQIDGQDLKDMFENTGGDGNGQFGFTSTKQLKSKTADGEQLVLENLMTDMGTASEAGNMGTDAADGTAGLVLREGNGNTILVNSKGHEFTQLIEKGIMGATFYYQITSVYLTDARVGDGVENDELEDGENYTPMEHHWDEAFGYLGVPVDFSSNWPSDRNDEARFLGNYIRGRDALLGSSDKLMNAFKKGRAAIVAKAYDVRDQQRDIIYAELEKVIAATAVHYINSALATLDDQGEFLHVLSEAYAFIKGLGFAPADRATLTDLEIASLLQEISDSQLNFWNTTQSGLEEAKETLVDAFGLEAVADQL